MTELTLNQKDSIREHLKLYCDKYPSRNRAAGSLKGVSPATVSAILNGKYENISEEMFRNILSQIFAGTAGWQIVETGAYREIIFALSDSQQWRNTTWVVGDAGCGKTTAAQMYAAEHGDVFYILCSEDMSKAEFIREIGRIIGLKTDRLPIRELWDAVMNALIQMEAPLMIFDEADKLTDNVFHYFISFYNRLEDKCGIIFLSTDYIKRRMDLGLRHNKKGYNEIHSRIGRKFFELDATTANDVHAVCVANGVGKAKIGDIIKDAQTYDFDLRRVKKLVHKVKRMSENEN